MQWDDNPQFDFTKEIKFLKLDDIDSGYIGTEFRIWMQVPNSDTIQVLVIKNLKKTWVGEFYYFKPVYKDLNLVTLGYRKLSAKPSSGDQAFTRLVETSEVFNFKTFYSIKNYTVCNDADVIVFEMAKNEFYKRNFYPCLSAHSYRLDEAKKVSEFILLIKKEFGIAKVD